MIAIFGFQYGKLGCPQGFLGVSPLSEIVLGRALGHIGGKTAFLLIPLKLSVCIKHNKQEPWEMKVLNVFSSKTLPNSSIS